MKSSNTVSLSFRVPATKARRIEKLADATDRPKSWLLEQALDAYLETHAWQVEHTQQGLDALRQGEVVAHDDVREWLSTWGSSPERKPPR